eukprot:414602-Hanusia_phi.AAC.6
METVPMLYHALARLPHFSAHLLLLLLAPPQLCSSLSALLAHPTLSSIPHPAPVTSLLAAPQLSLVKVTVSYAGIRRKTTG